MSKILCPKCKGRRVVFDPISLLTTIVLPIIMIMESDDNDNDISISKKRCPTCYGKGFIELTD